jgi:hypothetical protein
MNINIKAAPLPPEFPHPCFFGNHLAGEPRKIDASEREAGAILAL